MNLSERITTLNMMYYSKTKTNEEENIETDHHNSNLIANWYLYRLYKYLFERINFFFASFKAIPKILLITYIHFSKKTFYKLKKNFL